jgi:hypothetical protein
LDANCKTKIEQFLQLFNLEVCIGEDLEIDAKCKVSHGGLELYGGMIVRKYKFEDVEPN